MSRSAYKKLEHWTTRYAPIPRYALSSMIGEAVHLGRAHSPGYVWILDEINGDNILLHTPKTGKRIIASAKDAYYSRHWQQKLRLERTS